VTGRDLGNRYPVNPAFPLRKGRKWYWAVAFDTGLVICPEGAQDLLEGELSFSIENRFAWPIRWADERDDYVTHSINEAVEHPLMSLNAQDAKSLSRPRPPAQIEYFTTHPITDLEYYNDYREHISVEEYQLNTQENHAYGAETLYEGDALNAENLAPLVGKCVLYAESYSPERVKVGALLGVSDEGATIYYKAVSGGSSSIGNHGFASLTFVGEAIPAEAEAPTVEVPEDFNPEEGLRAQFPCGKNLSQLSNPDENATGELSIPWASKYSETHSKKSKKPPSKSSRSSRKTRVRCRTHAAPSRSASPAATMSTSTSIATSPGSGAIGSSTSARASTASGPSTTMAKSSNPSAKTTKPNTSTSAASTATAPQKKARAKSSTAPTATMCRC